jgi:guanylate kinase
MSKGGKLIVFSAPSGSGKTTIVRHLLSQEDLNLEFSISAASRESRGEEANGKDYYSFQLKNSNNTSRMTTFWNGKKFTETISTEL